MKGLIETMNKLTKLEKYWILYDVGNSAFILLVATIIPIYFNYLASLAKISEVNYLAYWGYASSQLLLLLLSDQCLVLLWIQRGIRNQSLRLV